MRLSQIRLDFLTREKEEGEEGESEGGEEGEGGRA